MKKGSLIVFLAWVLCTLTIAKFLYSANSLMIMGKKLLIVLFMVLSISGFALADVGILNTGIRDNAGAPVVDTQSQNKVIMYRNEIPIKVDYTKGVLIVQGKEIPIIVDDFGEKTDFKLADPKGKDWVDLTYDRFNVHIEPNYYASNTAELSLFFDRFEPRYELMETLTDWSSEEFYGKKLDIYVEEYSNCWWGYAIPGEVYLFLYEDLFNPNVCRFPYYVDGVPYYDNPGELGDHWYYMTGALHESLHAINPLPLRYRAWLTEGWSQYYQYNILSNPIFIDINQETADYYNYHGTPNYNWGGYVGNDYHDTTFENNEIQNSAGYDITAWMFSMLRNEHSLPWENFYTIMENNPETLDNSFILGDFYTDTHVLDLFERAIGVEMEPVFRYDGPSGPGWGVRQWTSLDWYADLNPELEVSTLNQVPGLPIALTATINNTGDVDLEGVVVKFYSEVVGSPDSRNLIGEQTIDVNASDHITLYSEFISSIEADYILSVVVDEENLKIESNEENNEDVEIVSYEYICGDVNVDGEIQIGDAIYLLNYLYRNGEPPICGNKCGDVNLDGIMQVGDVIYTINYLFRNGPEPCDSLTSSVLTPTISSSA